MVQGLFHAPAARDNDLSLAQLYLPQDIRTIFHDTGRP